jgi:putative hydrolase of the HAD superfamily
VSAAIRWVLFDIGGVLGTNGWDSEQRAQAVKKFGLDAEDFQYRHEETVGVLESGHLSLDEYLDVTVFCAPRTFTREAFRAFMFSLSVPYAESIAVARALRAGSDVYMMTLNNEAEELNIHRIERFGLRDLFSVFLSSCWLGVRKPTHQIYERAVGMLQADPRQCVFVDDREQNLGPARAMGMHAIRFESAGQLARDLRGAGLALAQAVSSGARDEAKRGKQN